MKLGNLFVNKDGKIQKPEQETTKEEDVFTDVDVQTEPEKSKQDIDEQPVKTESEPETPEETYRIVIYGGNRDVVYDVVGKDALKQELHYIESGYIDSNTELLMVPQHVLVKSYIEGWSYGRVSEPENYEAGDDEQH